jgi:hypothetical protein
MSKVGQQLLGMGAGAHLGERLLDLPVRADQVADASGAFRVGCVGRSIGQSELPLGVAQEREVELELLGEPGVGLLVVEADPEDLRVPLVVLLLPVAEPATLGGSTRCVGLRIEPEHDVLPAIVREPDRAARVIAHLEIGRLGSGLEHG